MTALRRFTDFANGDVTKFVEPGPHG